MISLQKSPLMRKTFEDWIDKCFSAVLFIAAAAGFVRGFRSGGLMAGIAVGAMFFCGAPFVAVPAFAVIYALFARGIRLEERVFHLTWSGSGVLAFLIYGYTVAWDVAPIYAFLYFCIGLIIGLGGAIAVFIFRNRAPRSKSNDHSG
jgi:hypothetical protein